MADERDVFMNKVITNEDIYDMLLGHGGKIDEVIKLQKITNGRVNKIEDQISNSIFPRIKCLEQSNIILFCKKYRWVIIALIILGILLATKFNITPKDLKEIINVG